MSVTITTNHLRKLLSVKFLGFFYEKINPFSIEFRKMVFD